MSATSMQGYPAGPGDDVPAALPCHDPFDWAASEPERPMFAVRAADGWHPVTAAEFADRASAIAAGLVATGVAPGDRVGLLAPACLDWLACDFAIWAAGAVTVPVYETSSVEQVRWELDDSGAVAAFAGGARYADTICRARAAKLETVWRMDGHGPGTLTALAQAGHDAGPGAAAEVQRRLAALTADTLATIVYTSGSTGQPKGCMISHGNLAAAVGGIMAVRGVRDQVLADDAAALFFLPLSHILARVVSLCMVRAGRRSGYLAGTGQLGRELTAFRPTILLAVPRVLEKVTATAREQAERSGHRRLFGAAERAAIQWSRADPGQHPRLHRGPWLRLRHAAFGAAVYPRLRAELGGQVAWVISGGAPLGEDVAHFLRGAGLPVMEGWGLTETTGAVTMNTPVRQRIGSVGLPVPGCAIRVSTDGELEVCGPSVFHGYWHDPAATATVLDGEWFRTGDLGQRDSDGYVYVTGRAKDLIITANGKNVAPGPIEDRVREHWLIAECVLVGERRPYIAALVTLDGDAFARWKLRAGKPAGATIAELRDDPGLRAAVSTAISRANAQVSHAESIKRYAILPDGFEVGEELTPTQKVRRSYVVAKYAAEIDALYPDAPHRL